MTLRTASKERTPCEIIRKINDLVQGDTETEKQIRKLCFEVELLSKQLATELIKYRNWWGDWYTENDTFETDIKNRLKDEYRTEE